MISNMADAIFVQGKGCTEVYIFEKREQPQDYGAPLPTSYIARGMELMLARREVTNSGIQNSVLNLGKK